MTIVSRSINVSNAMPYTSASTINTALILNSLEKWDVTPCLIGTLFHLSANSPDPNMHEKFFCILVALFIPWHDHMPLKQAADSWEDHFHSRLSHLSPRIHRYIFNINLLHKSKEESQFDRLQRETRQPTFMNVDVMQNFEDDEDEDDQSDESVLLPLAETLTDALTLSLQSIDFSHMKPLMQPMIVDFSTRRCLKSSLTLF